MAHRIGLNAHLLSGAASYRSAGIHHYIERLLHHLPAAGEGMEFVAFANKGTSLAVKGLRACTTRWPTQQPGVRILWEQVAQPAWALRAGVDLLHGLAFVSPLLRPCRTAVTVYDLSFVRFPELFHGANAAYLRLFTRLSCRAAERVIAISHSTRDDVARLYGLPPGRIDVAYPGVDPAFQPLPGQLVEAFRCKQGLPEKFILHVGTLEPRKNHIKLLEALKQLSTSKFQVANQDPQSALRNPQSKFQLVCVGAKGWFYDEIYAAVERLGLHEWVHFTSYVRAEELPLWYNAATLLVYPSLYEGFGMPVLEAMGCGTPVITSNVSSLPEAAGEAGLLVAPDDVGGLAEAMQRVLADLELQRALSEAGRAHAAGFTWERTARETVAAYRRTLSAA
ncbi:MAG: glycosyltransferase family 4 protein [Thermoflexales bacterium]|nr:glycosyltransferase family 4 protein [Thermoflexales bacterium]